MQYFILYIDKNGDDKMKENETKKFDQNAYINAYKKEKYKQMKLDVKPSEFEQITTYCKNMGISRASFLIKSALYIIENDLLSEIQK